MSKKKKEPDENLILGFQLKKKEDEESIEYKNFINFARKIMAVPIEEIREKEKKDKEESKEG